MKPLGYFQIFKLRSDAKEEWGAESNGKLLHLFIPSKTATFVPEFAVEDLTLGRTATLVPELPVKELPLGRTATLMPDHPVKDLPLDRTLCWWYILYLILILYFMLFYMLLVISIIVYYSLTAPQRGPGFASRLYPSNFSGGIGSGMGSTQPREDNWVATWYEK